MLALLVFTALAARVTWLRSERVRAQLTGVVILGYTGIFVITAWQALRGQSLVHPDTATWAAFGATVAVTALLALLTVVTARRRVSSGGRHAVARREFALHAG